MVDTDPYSGNPIRNTEGSISQILERMRIVHTEPVARNIFGTALGSIDKRIDSSSSLDTYWTARDHTSMTELDRCG